MAVPSAHRSVVEAWLSLFPARRPGGVACLQEESRSAVYRLDGVAPDGGAVIAKRSTESVVETETAIYRYILPHVGVTTLEFLGWVDAGRGYRWMYLEDAGGVAYRPRNSMHATLAGVWLARVQSRAAALLDSVQLPDRSMALYTQHLVKARQGLRGALELEVLADWGHRLVAVTDGLDALASRWDSIELLSSRMPPTLVHGDFVSKNVRVRSAADGHSLHAMDWELAGWGIGAVDLPFVDREAYAAAVDRSWWKAPADAVTVLADLGRILRAVVSVSWAIDELGGAEGVPVERIESWIDSLVESIAIYATSAHRSLVNLGLE